MVSDEILRDFDEEREERYTRPSKFKIGGEVLTLRRGLRPEEFRERMAPYNALTTESSDEDAITAYDEAIKAFLSTDDDVHRWERLRERKERAVTARDMIGVLNFLITEQTGLPTRPPSPSEQQEQPSGTSSTETSSSDPVASAVSTN